MMKRKQKQKNGLTIILGAFIAILLMSIVFAAFIFARALAVLTPPPAVLDMPLSPPEEEEESPPDPKDYFKGKTWLVIGDSLSLPNIAAEVTYVEHIKEWLDVEVINMAMSGTGYMRGFKESGNWIDSIDEYPKDVDFITVLGALNDFEAPLGEFGDISDDTMYGVLYSYYYWLTKKYPDTPIIVITSPPRTSTWGEIGKFVGHIDATIKTAEYYSLPVLDLYRQSGLLMWYDEDKQRFFSYEGAPLGDGTHLNDEGQLLIADMIYEFILLIPNQM